MKKAECWRIEVFELWCWRRLLRVPWTARRSNKSILKEISPEYSLQELTLEFQYFGHLIQRANPLEQTLMLGKIEGSRSWYHQLNGHEFEQAPEDSEGQGSLAYCRSWGCKESDTTEPLNDNNKASCLDSKCRLSLSEGLKPAKCELRTRGPGNREA